jgi:type II secretory pathway component PulF
MREGAVRDMAHVPMNPNPKIDNNQPVNTKLADVIIYPVLIVFLSLGVLFAVKNLI